MTCLEYHTTATLNGMETTDGATLELPVPVTAVRSVVLRSDATLAACIGLSR